MGDNSRNDWTVERGPTIGGIFDKADRLANERRADLDGAALPKVAPVVPLAWIGTCAL